MSAHSKIGASSMYRWSNCPGSVRLSRGIESVSSPYAEEGTRAHEIAAQFLMQGQEPPKDLDPDTRDAISTYLNFVLTSALQSDEAQVLVEHRFDLSKIHPGLFGTADCVIYKPERHLLQVIDYKHGAGLPVEVKNNLQLLYYGLGAMLSIEEPIETVELTIVQPRCPHPDGPIRSWTIPAMDLDDFAVTLKVAALRTEEENAELVAGDHCRFCPAAGICPKLHEKAIALAKEEFRSDLSYDPIKLSHALTLLPMIEAWSKQVREFAYNESLHGRIPPGYKLVEKRASRKWLNQKEAEEFLKMDEALWDKKLKSPAQAEKILSKKVFELVEPFIVKESSGTTLVQDSDPRPSVLSLPQSEFTRLPAGGGE